MFPTYNGMTSELCSEALNPAEKWFERIFRSASFYEVKAPVSGEVSICVNRVARTGNEDVFEAYVGNVPVSIRCPRDFSMDAVFLERFFPEHANDKSLSSHGRGGLEGCIDSGGAHRSFGKIKRDFKTFGR